MIWERLGAVSPRELVPARLVLHWAAQLVAAASAALLPPAPDDSHTTLSWDAARRAFVGRPIGERAIALQAADLTITVSSSDRERALPLAGTTRADALAWLAAALDHPLGPGVALPPYPHLPPAHPVGGDAPFPAADAGHAELARWYGNAAALIGAIAAESPEAGPLRVWPHHFDLATLFDLGAGRTVGAGLSPGDASYAEPYFYVTPWPAPPVPPAPVDDGPDEGTGPPLPHGHWHTGGWFGAVLAGDAAMDSADAEAFLRAAIAACRERVAKR